MKGHKTSSPDEPKSDIFDSALFFKMMFENSEHTGILVMNTKGVILDINYGFQKCFGYSKESLLGKSFSMLFIEEDLKKNLPEREVEGTLSKGSYNDDNYLKMASGKPIWVHGESIYIKDHKDQEFIVKVVQDINEEKILEGQLKEKNEEQERIILDHETFIYTVSHDLQSPLNNIYGLVRELIDYKPKDSEAILSMVEKSLIRLKNKIKELSEVGREQEQIRNPSQEVEFRQIYEEVMLDLKGEVELSGAEINADFSKATKVIFIKRNLRSILQNLLSNAVKYRDSRRNLQVTVESEKTDDGYIMLSVKDNGVGIADADIKKIFKMYGRLQKDNKGTGVGMAIVKRMVDNAGGGIEVESKVGSGSTFKIYFPVETS